MEPLLVVTATHSEIHTRATLSVKRIAMAESSTKVPHPEENNKKQFSACSKRAQNTDTSQLHQDT